MDREERRRQRVEKVTADLLVEMAESVARLVAHLDGLERVEKADQIGRAAPSYGRKKSARKAK